ncbi:MAG: hypothetical protein FWF99_01715 [Desulfovibrionaceae bacterium]|nr:hypothetical protein [Desulfovibrionaceae bacterium]
MKNQQDEQCDEDEFDPSLPQVDTIRVEYAVGIRGEDNYDTEGVLDKLSYSERIDCSNRHCEGSGFSFCGLIQQMTEKREEKEEGEIPCRGTEPRFKGSRNRIHIENPKKCMGYIKYKTTIRYKTTEK